jgi:hypothetical protein
VKTALDRARVVPQARGQWQPQDPPQQPTEPFAMGRLTAELFAAVPAKAVADIRRSSLVLSQ